MLIANTLHIIQIMSHVSPKQEHPSLQCELHYLSSCLILHFSNKINRIHDLYIWNGLVQQPFIRGDKEVLRPLHRADSTHLISTAILTHLARCDNCYLPPPHVFITRNGGSVLQGEYQFQFRLVRVRVEISMKIRDHINNLSVQTCFCCMRADRQRGGLHSGGTFAARKLKPPTCKMP